jgi:hypothetical protein
MKTRLDFVTNDIGGMIMAEVIICAECDNDSFHIFNVKGHSHLQCVACGETFCGGQGECELTKKRQP